MIDLFYKGGPLFMGILTIIFLIMLSLSAALFFRGASVGGKVDLISSDLIKQIGLFALIFGIFGQLLGLYQAFNAIQQMGTVSPALLAGGLQVSMITTIYGVIIFMCSLVLKMAVDYSSKSVS
jgi:hypothetical protein